MPFNKDRESQDKNLVGLLDQLIQFPKTAGSHDSVDSILTHAYPYYKIGITFHFAPHRGRRGGDNKQTILDQWAELDQG